MRNPYVILGVRADAELNVIRKAYHVKARDLHPDHHPERADEFQEVTWAWNLLRNQASRAKWDRDNGLVQSNEPTVQDTISSPPGMIARKGDDIVETLRISFRAAYEGGTFTLSVQNEKLCGICGGSGSAPGHVPYPCMQCGGKGFHKAGRLEKPCRHCQGKGMIIEVPCTGCYQGRVSELVRYEVVVPPRSKHGQLIRIPEAGMPGWAQAGDLIIELDVSPSTVYQQGPEDGDLLVEVPINWSEAVLGGQVTVPTPQGPMRITLPAGTSSEQIFRLAGLGLSRGADYGDLYARVRVVVPRDVDPSLRRHIASLRAWEDDRDREELLKRAHNEWQA
jgi:molecular chaperone DnaJ